MKFILILPDTRASTLCPLLSSTRKNAFGSGSTTTPSTSIASSFGDGFFSGFGGFFLAECRCIPPRLRRAKHTSVRHAPFEFSPFGFVDDSQDLIAIRSHRDRVLEVRGQRAVRGHDGPLVVERAHVGLARVDHRL